MLVEMFTPWCHFCHMMAPEFDAFYESYQVENSKDYRPDLLIGRVNAGEEQQLAFSLGVSAFPTILIFNPHSKETKHRVEGYQRRYDLARLLAHALPEKPAVERVEERREEQKKEVKVEVVNNEQEENQGSDTQATEEVLEPIEEEEIEVEYEIVYRDSAAAIKDELNSTSHHIITSFQSFTERQNVILSNLLNEVKSLYREEILRAAERYDRLEARIEELHLDVKQRNRLESAQTRLNVTHMVLFLVIGAVGGAAVCMLLGKVTAQHTDRSKV